MSLADFICDHCGQTFQHDLKNNYADKEFHFCCHQHYAAEMRKGGKIYCRKQQRNLVKYGVDHHMKDPAVMANYRQSMMDTYGVECNLELPQVQDSIKSSFQKYGGHPLRDPEIRQKQQQTTLERHGVSCILAHPDLQQKSHAEDAKEKRQKSLKHNGTMTKSHTEDRFFDCLVAELRAETDVQRHVRTLGFNVDFFVPKLQLYIEFDGIYWHGLDQDDQFLQQHRPKIFNKKQRDLKQNDDFKRAGLKLLRVTDREFLSAERDGTERELIRSILRSAAEKL